MLKKIIKNILICLLGPLNIIPLFYLQFKLFGQYTGDEIGHLQILPLILQGSSDLAGSNIYAVFLSLFISLGVSATFYLYLCLCDKSDFSLSKLRRYGLFYLSVHIVCFIFASILFLHPDERNMTLLFSLIYLLTFFIVIGMVKRKLKGYCVFFAPVLIYAFVFMAWDGSSPKSGQILNCGEEPQWKQRSARHYVILLWHKFADGLFSCVGMDNDR